MLCFQTTAVAWPPSAKRCRRTRRTCLSSSVLNESLTYGSEKITMPFYSVTAHARQTEASPSVTLERGAYRMRAPPARTSLSLGTSKLSPTSSSGSQMSPRRMRRSSQTLSRDTFPVVLHQEKQIAVLLVVLICAAMSCFGVAYYLFTTR